MQGFRSNFFVSTLAIPVLLLAGCGIQGSHDDLIPRAGPSANNHPWPTAHLTAAVVDFGLISKSCGNGSIYKM